MSYTVIDRYEEENRKTREAFGVTPVAKSNDRAALIEHETLKEKYFNPYMTQERCLKCLMPCVERSGSLGQKTIEIFTPFGPISKKDYVASDYSTETYEGIAETCDSNGVFGIYHYVRIVKINDRDNQSTIGYMGVVQNPDTDLFESFSCRAAEDGEEAKKLVQTFEEVEEYFNSELDFYPAVSFGDDGMEQ